MGRGAAFQIVCYADVEIPRAAGQGVDPEVIGNSATNTQSRFPSGMTDRKAKTAIHRLHAEMTKLILSVHTKSENAPGCLFSSQVVVLAEQVT